MTKEFKGTGNSAILFDDPRSPGDVRVDPAFFDGIPKARPRIKTPDTEEAPCPLSEEWAVDKHSLTWRIEASRTEKIYCVSFNGKIMFVMCTTRIHPNGKGVSMRLPLASGSKKCLKILFKEATGTDWADRPEGLEIAKLKMKDYEKFLRT